MNIFSSIPTRFLSLLCALLLPCVATAQDDAAAPAVKQPLRVAASFATVRGPYQQWAQAFSDHVETLGAVSMTISANGDAKTQEQHCDYLVDQKISALALMPVNMESASSIVAHARSRGIPVLALEHMIEDCELDLLITTDLKAGGQHQVESLLKTTSGGFVMLGDVATQEALLPLQQGRLRALSKHIMRKRVQLLGHEWLNPSTTASSQRALTELVTLKGPPNVVLVTHPDQAVGAILSLRKIGAEDLTKISGFRPNLDSCRRILQGHQHSSLYLSYADAGRQSAELVYKMSTRQPIQVEETRHNGTLEVPVSLLTPTLLTRENVMEVMTRDGVYTRRQLQP